MRLTAICAVFLLTGIAFSQDSPPVERLIQQLGSPDYRTRDAAMKRLVERPDAEGALRAAIQAEDREIVTRAAILVKEIEYRRSDLRQLDLAIEHGHVERAIELIAAWREDKLDSEYWQRAQMLAKQLTDGSENLWIPDIWEFQKWRIKAPHVTAADFTPPRFLTGWIVRAGEVDVQFSRTSKEWRSVHAGPIFVFSSGRVRIDSPLHTSCFIFANGDVQMDSEMVAGCIIVSGGNVTIEHAPVLNSVVIAKRTVRVHQRNHEKMRVIVGGKGDVFESLATVNTPRRLPNQTLILEKQANPLGYIRWRQEAEPKKGEK